MCAEPLTPWLHFADLVAAQPKYMEHLVRVVHSLGVLLGDLSNELRPVANAGTCNHDQRSQHHLTGIPYMLHNPGCAAVHLSSWLAWPTCTVKRPCAAMKLVTSF